MLAADLSQERLDVMGDIAPPEAGARAPGCVGRSAGRGCAGAAGSAFGPIGGLVNSAGIGQDLPFLDTETAALRRMLEVNLVGSFVVAREVARRMRKRGHGSIVNITSVSGIRGNAGRAAYGASRAGW